jgi:hypothetical protein
MVEDSKTPLYPGCKEQHTKLHVILSLLQMKASNGWSDKSFTELLQLIGDLLPAGHILPETTYQAKKVWNIRFGLSTDGMNPFGDMSSRHSTWPVALVIYNLPSWLCMKRKYIMMPLLIQGPKQPGNDIDVYFRPLVDDLKLLWHRGVQMWDAYKREYFTLRAMLFFTIQDYPCAGNTSGQTVKGGCACLQCMRDTASRWLRYSEKTVYMRHRRFLPADHQYHSNTREFDGTVELEDGTYSSNTPYWPRDFRRGQRY